MPSLFRHWSLIFFQIKRPTELAINEMLTYWVVWGVFTTTESSSDRLFSWFPIYYAIKFMLLLWCLLPGSQGSAIIYNYVLKPIFMKHHERIDNGLRHTRHHVSATLDRMFFKRLLSKDYGRAKSGGSIPTNGDEKRRKLETPVQVGEYKTM
uniref:Receptor expression-enhancing protein n=1 Tax=Lotharella globosa TaxID=91324 RepID=A0A7S4E0L3_9EUKA